MNTQDKEKRGYVAAIQSIKKFGNTVDVALDHKSVAEGDPDRDSFTRGWIRACDDFIVSMETTQRKDEMNVTNTPTSPWHPDTERPEEGRVVWVIERHPKTVVPQSYRLSSGVVEYERHNMKQEWRVANDDDFGNGSEYWYPKSAPYQYAIGGDDFCAWAYAEDVNLLPDFILPKRNPTYSTDQHTSALELVDGAYEIVELYKPTTASGVHWKMGWLKKARELGAQPM